MGVFLGITLETTEGIYMKLATYTDANECFTFFRHIELQFLPFHRQTAFV